ncbi:MAG: hypothetical protein RL096_355 [Actinomycetota bacterium]
MSIKVVTVNVNGVRAAFRKGMAEWIAEANADIIALQEVRAETKDLVDLFATTGEWHILHDAATAKGRAGVAIASKLEPVAHRTNLGPDEFDSAGRWLEVDFNVGGKTLTVISTYVHSGEVDTPKQDLNVGHTELDIKNWKGNLKNAGFLPEERAYFDTLMKKQGWVDVGREAHPEQPGPYTWWSFRGQAFDTDAGWRIDYHLATPALAAVASDYKVERAASYDTRWTDHSPVVVDYSI